MNKSMLLAAAGMISLAAELAGGAQANVPSEELRNHPDYDRYAAALADGSMESLQKFLVERPASPFVGLVFAQATQQVQCNDPNALLDDPNCQAPVAAIY